MEQFLILNPACWIFWVVIFLRNNAMEFILSPITINTTCFICLLKNSWLDLMGKIAMHYVLAHSGHKKCKMQNILAHFVSHRNWHKSESMFSMDIPLLHARSFWSNWPNQWDGLVFGWYRFITLNESPLFFNHDCKQVSTWGCTSRECHKDSNTLIYIRHFYKKI